jgi:hypothetical protein
LIRAIVLKKGLLMSYGKTVELGFLGLRGKHQDRFYLKNIKEEKKIPLDNIIHLWVLNRLGHMPT